MADDPRAKLVEAPGANIAEGRNIGIRSAIGEVIATTDGGCRVEPDWLEKLTKPFEDDPTVEFVAGFYEMQCLLRSCLFLLMLIPVIHGHSFFQ